MGKQAKKKHSLNACEVLAPAGSPEHLRAAVENGADAVYFGGPLFNARMNAANFSYDDIKEAVAYTHPRGVKLYVAFNTLIHDDEMPQALRYAADLYELGIDACIVQDWGLVKLIHEMLPKFPVHLSTQASVYNLSGAKMAVNMGAERVVPARELSLTEIRELTANAGCEIEVFVHGALCVCYSGQCQLSRSIGGRSANRGECAQPCRLAYAYENGERGHFLSPKDLCLVEELPALLAAGVASLKIEGRMKSPQYVAEVTRIYRKYTDLATELLRTNRQSEYKVSAEDMEALQQIYSRSGFTKGYLDGVPRNNDGAPDPRFLTKELPKHSGLYAGKVLGMVGRDLVDVQVARPLQIGDGIEIRGKDGTSTGNLVTYLDELAKGILRIGDVKVPVKKGDLVYRTAEKSQLDRALESYRVGRRKLQVHANFYAYEGSFPQLEVEAITDILRKTGTEELADCRIERSNAGEGLQKIVVTAEGSSPVQAAQNKPLTEDRAKSQLEKSGDSPFTFAAMRVFLQDGVFLPISELNDVRRKALHALELALGEGRSHVAEETVSELLAQNRESFAAEDFPKAMPEKTWRLPVITHGNCDRKLEASFNELPKTVLVENAGWISELQEAGKEVLGGAGLNICNRWAKAAFEAQGVRIAEASREFEENPELLMTLEFPIKEGVLTDRKGKKYSVKRSEYGDKTEIRSL